MENNQKFDFSSLKVEEVYDIVQTKQLTKSMITSESGKLNPHVNKTSYVVKNKLEPLLSSIWFHTAFLDEKASLIERKYCILNDIRAYPRCEACQKEVRQFYGGSRNRYNKACSSSCAIRIGSAQRSPEVFLKNAKKASITRRANGNYDNLKFKNVWTNEARNKRRATNLKKYGVENAGVLGAYSSKAACEYISNFLNEHNIPHDRCYFHGGGVNGSEFYQYISGESKNHFVSYDLTVFKSSEAAIRKSLSDITMIVEYNGPWHYTQEESAKDPTGNATPYPNSKTKMETYLHDQAKIDHVKRHAEKIFVYWEQTNTLQRIK